MSRLISLTDDDIKIINKAFSACPELYSATKKIQNKLDKSQKRITISSAKAKGREFQFWVCRKISELLNIPYNQQDDNCEIHSREMSQQGVDIVLRGQARSLFPFDIECKAMKSFDIHDAVQQADKNAGLGRIGMVAFRQTNKETVFIFSWESFVKMFNWFLCFKKPSCKELPNPRRING